MKRFTALCCSVILLALLLVPCAFAEAGAGEAEPDILTLKTVAGVAHNIQVSYPRGEVRICPAVLETESGARDVYFVTVRSLDRVAKGPNNLLGALLLFCNKDCRYFRLTKKAIQEYVPAGSAIVIAGHSMGGMVVQRIICDDTLTETYEFLNAVTFGSPCVVTDKARREGRLVRFEDAGDIIPKLSLARLIAPSDYEDAIRIDCGYSDLDVAHNWSYYGAEAWYAYDVLGVENGSAVLRLDMNRLVALAFRMNGYFERRPV